MTRFDIRKRDGLARSGIFQTDTISVKLPAALAVETLFPDLDMREGTNLPLCAPSALVKHYPPRNNGQPVSIHPHLDNPAQSGDCVMVANWQTALSNPRNYVDWLIGLKEKTPVDTAWYAPASGLPSNVHILCYSGFDLFDFRAVDLKTAQKQFCTPEGEFPADALDSGICTCSGCQEKDLKMHNRQELLHEIALVTRFIEESQLRDLVESRCRLNAAQVAIMRHLDNQYQFMERHIACCPEWRDAGKLGRIPAAGRSPAFCRTGDHPVSSRQKQMLRFFFPVRQKNPTHSRRATENSVVQLPVAPMN